MIFFLASLQNCSFREAEKIFKLYSEGNLKDQQVSGSKKGINSVLDLKASSFKSFRGLDPPTVYQLLSDLSQKKYSLKEILAHCNDIKAVQKVQTSFLKVTNYESWEEASTKYPHYTTSEKWTIFVTRVFVLFTCYVRVW